MLLRYFQTIKIWRINVRRKLALILICAACMTFGGCIIEQAPLNEKELDMVAQYAADLLLKYDKNYKDFLLTKEQLTPTPTKSLAYLTSTPTATPTSTTAPTRDPNNPNPPTSAPAETPTPTLSPTPTEVPDNTSETFKQTAGVIGAEGLTVDFDGDAEPVVEFSYKVGDGIMNLPARKDGKLYLLTKFLIKNESGGSSELNCFAQDITCILNINGNINMYPCDTLFPNDLRFVGVGDSPQILKAGESYEAVLIFAVDKDTEISKAALTLTNKNKESVVIKVK